ncbi:MAG: DUF512 domain-containing protein [Clostridia bacterium]
MPKITKVDKNSVCEELGIKVGEELIGFNDENMVDILDYIFYNSQEAFTMTILSCGELTDFDIEKDAFEDLGLSFEDMELKPIRCKNKCAFCFVDQLPKGMRETLYVKDDDYRLSFISGNYITLTNCGKQELQRIVKLHLSPLYISVHAFNKDVKNFLVTNPEGGKLFDKIAYLASNNITMHTQIVMCKDINDGDVLKQTVEQLYKFYPKVKSLAIVPVGLTNHRDGLKKLEQIDSQTAKNVIDYCKNFNAKLREQFVFCSDEFYLRAKIPLPNYEEYGDFEQIEDGVGLVQSFVHDADFALENVAGDKKIRKISLITGKSFASTLKQIVDKIKLKFVGLQAQVFDITNNFFGESITVAGLVTAKDILEQTSGKLAGVTIIPSNMLREFSDTFLDGVTVKELEKQLNTKILVCLGGENLIELIEEVQND